MNPTYKKQNGECNDVYWDVFLTKNTDLNIHLQIQFDYKFPSKVREFFISMYYDPFSYYVMFSTQYYIFVYKFLSDSKFNIRTFINRIE